MAALEVQLPTALRQDFGRCPLVATHNLRDHPLFTDQALCALLDRFPRQHLYAWSMGQDATRPEENRLAATEGVSGVELLEAVRRGRFWLNLTRIDRVEPRYRALIEAIYRQLTQLVPHFQPKSCQGAVLISSPQALVYYHADAPANMLWHVRGRKRIWIYPAMDERYLQRESLEDIFAGVRHEYLTYQADFDRNAVCYDVEPGQWLSWPHNAPHRVTNLEGLNISLATEHFTAESLRRQRLYVANRFLRKRLGLKNPSSREDGAVAMLKTVVHRAAARLGLDPLQYKRYAPVLRVNARAPGGVSALPGAESLPA
jgi:hypothetical protein